MVDPWRTAVIVTPAAMPFDWSSTLVNDLGTPFARIMRVTLRSPLGFTVPMPLMVTVSPFASGVVGQISAAIPATIGAAKDVPST